jgi:hypothetical protein
MFETTREFWLKWRLRISEKRILANTLARKALVLKHQRQVANAELIKIKLESAS